METTNEENTVSKPNRVNELYSMYKTMKQSQQINIEEAEENRERNEMLHCTFKPKIIPLNREIFYKSRNDLYDDSNESYIKKMKKIRDDKLDKERKKKEMSDRRMRITVPKEFNITSNKSNDQIKNDKHHHNDIHYLCQYNTEKGIKIDKKMNYSDAIRLLHNELLNSNIISEDNISNLS